jgi:flagellar biosynthesis/type III secretory pathway chaperone
MISEKLLDALNGLENSYKKLIELASLKKEAILINNYDELVKITGLEQKCANDIAAAEKERARTVELFLKEKGLPLDTGLGTILKGGFIAGENAPAVAAVRERLIKLTGELKKMNDENNRLIASSREVIEKSLEFVKNKIGALSSKSPLTGTGAYSNIKKTGPKSAQPRPENLDSSLLDFIV